MSETRKIYRLRDILEVAKSPIDMKDEEDYMLASIRRRNGGMFDRETKKGKEILTKTLNRVIPGSFVISKMQVVHGACGMAPLDFGDRCISASYASLLPTEPQRIDIGYLDAFATTKESYDAFFRASHGVHIEKMTFNLEEWLNREIELPPLSEQKKIAEILSGIDRCIDNLKDRCKKSKELIAATEEITFDVFRKDDADRQEQAASEGKEAVPLGDIFEFRNGLNYSKANSGKGLKVVGVGDFKDYRTPKYDSLGEISPKGLDFNLSLLNEGDFVFVRSNGNRLLIGRCLSIEKMPKDTPVAHSGFTIRARPRNHRSHSRDYIRQLLQSRIFRRSVADLGGGTNISNLSQDIIANTMIALPSMERQSKESSALFAIQHLLDSTQRKVIQLEAMRVAASSDLLSGRKRVSV